MAKYLDNAGLERLAALLNGKLGGKQDRLTGQSGQVVGFDTEGNAVAQEGVTMDDVNAAITQAVTGAIEEGY
ncbi:MAG: hypothetical protein K1W21_10905 [Oscillospiraceae bacterium]|jgi:hypothetical protein